MAQDIIRVDILGTHQTKPRNIAGYSLHAGVAAIQKSEHFPAKAQILQDRGEFFCFRERFFKIIDTDQVLALIFHVQSFPQSPLADLLGNTVAEIPGMRTEDNAAFFPQRRTDGTMTSASGPFLAPRLYTAAGNLFAGLCRGVTLPLGGLIHEDRLMDHVLLDILTEDLLRKIDSPRAFPFNV